MVLSFAFFEVGSVVLTCWLAALLGALPFVPQSEVSSLVTQAAMVSLSCTALFYYQGLYDLRVVRSFGDFAPKLLQSLGVLLTGFGIAYLVAPSLRPQLVTPAALVMVAVALVVPLRAIGYGLMDRRAAHRVLILGTGSLACKIAKDVQAVPGLGYTVVGFVDDSDSRGLMPPQMTRMRPPYPAISRLQFLQETIEELRPDVIVVALSERRGRLPMWHLLSTWSSGVRVEDGIAFYERITQKLAIESLSPSFLIFSQTFRKSWLQLSVRRLISLGVATVGLVVTAPLMLLTALAIKLESRGPVFFVQPRTGLGGHTFNLIKFRTMRAAPPSATHSVWHRDERDRITPLGAWLRKLRIDELPQFINILRGDMDLVGPRPEMAANVATMSEQIPYYPIRHMVRPGVTGWAQVRFGYAVTQEEVAEKTRFDLYYIKNMSLAFDARIIADTAKTMLFGRGAR